MSPECDGKVEKGVQGVEDGGRGRLLGPWLSVLVISLPGPLLCLDCCVWIKQIGLHLTL